MREALNLEVILSWFFGGLTRVALAFVFLWMWGMYLPLVLDWLVSQF